MEETSEFGKGFTYCIGLFLAHQHMMESYQKESPYLWFNGASDHLFELQIRDNFVLKDACLAWKEEVLDLGHGRGLMEKGNFDDIAWSLNKAKEFLMAWDKQCGIDVEKGRWE